MKGKVHLFILRCLPEKSHDLYKQKSIKMLFVFNAENSRTKLMLQLFYINLF
jgi:hypothetical protein